MVMFLVAALLVAWSDQKAADVKLKPATVSEIDLGKMRGSLVRQLAWSPAGELYLQTYEPDKQALPREIFHYLIPTTGGAPKQLEAPPDWAADYWAWKSAQAAPGDPAFKIELETKKAISAATSLPMAGEMAKGGVDASGGTGASVDAMLDAARQSQNTTTYTMRLKGEVVGEWVNHPIIPGLTFGWGPTGSGLIAYAERQSGKLVIMDKSGAKRKFNDTKGVVLPAWTADGSRLAYLESRGRNKYAVMIATVQH